MLQGSDVTTYLYEQLECKEKELFVVVRNEVDQNQSWQHSDPIRNHVHLEAASRALLPDSAMCNNRTISSPLLELNR